MGFLLECPEANGMELAAFLERSRMAALCRVCGLETLQAIGAPELPPGGGGGVTRSSKSKAVRRPVPDRFVRGCCLGQGKRPTQCLLNKPLRRAVPGAAMWSYQVPVAGLSRSR